MEWLQILILYYSYDIWGLALEIANKTDEYINYQYPFLQRLLLKGMLFPPAVNNAVNNKADDK